MRLSKDTLRRRLFASLSALYAREVPLYDKLLETVRAVNEQVAKARPDLVPEGRDIEALSAERHGAIRLGKPDEMRDMARFFACLDMFPVNFYNLAAAGARSQPVISTAFRPLRDPDHRVFCSLLMTDGFDTPTRGRIQAILSQRRIFSDALLRLIHISEAEGGLTEEEARSFLAEAQSLFGWRGRARDLALYRGLVEARLNIAADIACFPNPHLNHLTPNTLDIDLLHAEMVRRLATDYAHLKHNGMKETIEGPPRRAVPILLRQTAYKALAEPVVFANDDGTLHETTHTARFGEVEQRGAAMTRAGRALYDAALARQEAGEAAQAAFASIPDDLETLRRERLIHARYERAPGGASGPVTEDTLEAAIKAGVVKWSPLRYEDFLPVSAAGIFASNLGRHDAPRRDESAPEYTHAQLEGLMQARIHEAHDLYEAIEAESRAAILKPEAPLAA